VSHEYVVILRCRSLGTWPSGTWSMGTIGDVQLVTAEAVQEYPISLFLVSYARDKETGSDKAGLKLWKGDTPQNLLLGDRLFIARGEHAAIKFNLHAPESNELDLGAKLTSDANVEPRTLIRRCTPCLYGLAFHLSLALHDLLTPTAPPQLLEQEANGELSLRWSGIMQAFDRPVHTDEQIEEVLSAYVTHRVHASPSDAAAIDVAARRYLSAQRETDPIDRFCDLWEACEFLSRTTPAKGDVVSRIAAALAQYTNKKKAELENKLDVRTIYQIRKDLVHNAIEDETKMNDKLLVLEAIAKELIRMRMNIKYDGNPIIDQAVR
jgi:hypothetical protein